MRIAIQKTKTGSNTGMFTKNYKDIVSMFLLIGTHFLLQIMLRVHKLIGNNFCLTFCLC